MFKYKLIYIKLINMANISKINVSPKKDWRMMEYVVPISEALNSGKDFVIRGTAINETTTRNGITYVAKELQMAAPSFRNKPILLDHSNSVKDIVGRTTENVNWSEMNKSIEFEAKIMDSRIKEMINDGRITDVSIGAKVQDLIQNEDDGSITAVGMEGMEISLVAVPGDPGANLANALSESFKLKEIDMNGEELDLSPDEADKLELNNEEEDNMEEAENNQVDNTNEVTPEVETKEETKEEKAQAVTNVNVDMSAVTESIKALTEQVSSLAKKVNEQEAPAPSATAEEEEISEPVADETTGDVGNNVEEEPAVAEENFVVEKAETGRGFQLYREYSKDTGKFNRLCR